MRTLLCVITALGSLLAAAAVSGLGCGSLPADCPDRYRCPDTSGPMTGTGGSTTATTTTATGGGAPLRVASGPLPRSLTPARTPRGQGRDRGGDGGGGPRRGRGGGHGRRRRPAELLRAEREPRARGEHLRCLRLLEHGYRRPR